MQLKGKTAINNDFVESSAEVLVDLLVHEASSLAFPADTALMMRAAITVTYLRLHSPPSRSVAS